jgi:nitroimidazol reductase NimA-like FMN-containing flavoprotein (pyridoxamine 5'-phosphate oxidase superfamily)
MGVVMPEHVTQLDERYSDPDAQPTRWAGTKTALATALLSWISTVRTDGRPHVTPLVVVWVDDTVNFCTGPEEQKARNLASNPSVVVTTGCNRWDHGLDVVVEGEAERITDQATLERLAAAWAATWDWRWRYRVTDEGFAHPDAGGRVLVFSVRATKIIAFAKGRFSHTRYLPASEGHAAQRDPLRRADQFLDRREHPGSAWDAQTTGSES